jgi:hypothetical protein
MSHAALLPFQPDHMNAGQLAAVAYLARYPGPSCPRSMLTNPGPRDWTASS